MSDQDYEVIVSAGLYAPTQDVRPYNRSALVLYDCLTKQPPDLLRKIDALGHTVIAPILPGSPSPPNFSSRALFYPTQNPFSMSAEWQTILDHSRRHTGLRKVFQIIVVGECTILAADRIASLLRAMPPAGDSCGLTFELVRSHPNELWHQCQDRYESVLDASPVGLWDQIDKMNGVEAFAWLNRVTLPDVEKAIVDRAELLARIPTTGPGRAYLGSRVTAWQQWTEGCMEIFTSSDRLFLSVGGGARWAVSLDSGPLMWIHGSRA